MRKGPRRWLFEIRWASHLLWWRIKCRFNDLTMGPQYSKSPTVIVARAFTLAGFRASVRSDRMYLFASPEEKKAEIEKQAEEFNKALADYQDALTELTQALQESSKDTTTPGPVN